jgi:hypothetical protein
VTDRFHVRFSAGQYQWEVQQEGSDSQPESFESLQSAWTRANRLARENNGQALLHDDKKDPELVTRKKVYKDGSTT